MKHFTPYNTFLTQEQCDYLNNYVEERLTDKMKAELSDGIKSWEYTHLCVTILGDESILINAGLTEGLI